MRKWGRGPRIAAVALGAMACALVFPSAVAAETLLSALAAAYRNNPQLNAERARVRLVLLDGREALTGELRSVGQDVVRLRADGEAHASAYARIGAVAEVIVG